MLVEVLIDMKSTSKVWWVFASYLVQSWAVISVRWRTQKWDALSSKHGSRGPEQSWITRMNRLQLVLQEYLKETRYWRDLIYPASRVSLNQIIKYATESLENAAAPLRLQIVRSSFRVRCSKEPIIINPGDYEDREKMN